MPDATSPAEIELARLKKRNANIQRQLDNIKKRKDADARKTEAKPTNDVSKGLKGEINRIENAVAAERAQAIKDVGRILTTIALPNTEDPVRNSLGGGQRRTAIAQSFSIIDVPWQNAPNTASSRYYLDSSDSFGAVFADPRRAAIFYDPNQSAAQWSYDVMYRDTSNNVGISSSARVNSEDYPEMCYAVATSGIPYKPHGNRLWAGAGPNGVTFLWADSPGGGTTATFSGLAISSTYALHVYQFVDGEGVQVAVITFTTNGSGVAVYTLPHSGYYAFDLTEATGVTNNAYTLRITGTSSCMCHREMTDWSIESRKVLEAAVLSCSIMYSNRAPEFSTAGQILTTQVDGAIDWMTAVGLSDASGQLGPGQTQNNLRGMPQSDFALTLTKKGAYGFKKPVDIQEEWELREINADPPIGGQFSSSTSSPIPLPYPLQCDTPYVIICPHILPVEGAATSTVQDGIWTFMWCLEYTTASTWDDTAQPDIKPSSLGDIVFGLRKLPNFHENPWHFMDIINFARTNVLPIATKLLGAISAVAPAQFKIPLLGASALSAALELEPQRQKQRRVPRRFKKNLYT